MNKRKLFKYHFIQMGGGDYYQREVHDLAKEGYRIIYITDKYVVMEKEDE